MNRKIKPAEWTIAAVVVAALVGVIVVSLVTSSSVPEVDGAKNDKRATAVPEAGNAEKDEKTPAGMYEAIRMEVMRSNNDPEGRPLPLASRWNVHIFIPQAFAPGVAPGNRYRFPFVPARAMAQIEAGHHVIPQIPSPRGQDVPWEEWRGDFERIAEAGLPFEFTGTNWLDEVLKNPDDYWHRPMAENPAHIRADRAGRIAETTSKGETTIKTVKWAKFGKIQGKSRVLKSGQHVIFAGHGRVYEVGKHVYTDSEGQATLQLAEPLREAVQKDEAVHWIEPKLDWYAEAPLDLYRRAGAALARNIGGKRWAKMAEIYPDPPMVHLLSNNEGGRRISRPLRDGWRSWAFQQQVGGPNERDDWPPVGLMREEFGKGYAEKVSAFLEGMKQELPWPAERIRTTAYNGLISGEWEVGRWPGWNAGSAPMPGADQYTWPAWRGASPSFYVYGWNYATDQHVGSPHIGAMQAFVMLSERAMQQIPDFHWEISFSDGGRKQRKKYAKWGGLPPTAQIGVTAEPAGDEAGREIRITGATSNALLAYQGQFVGFERHSRKDADPEKPTQRLYWLREDVRSDADGNATLLLQNPVAGGDDFAPLIQGQAVTVHDYMPRYEGLAKFALWLNRPRIIREFSWSDFPTTIDRKEQAILNAVDQVWATETARRFWRRGSLVVNPEYENTTGLKHPFDALLQPWEKMWKDTDRFYLLTCSLNPAFKNWPSGPDVARHKKHDSHIKVWAIALELGEEPEREWLVLAQSPRKDRSKVDVEIPGYGPIEVDAPRQGALHHLRESSGRIQTLPEP